MALLLSATITAPSPTLYTPLRSLTISVPFITLHTTLTEIRERYLGTLQLGEGLYLDLYIGDWDRGGNNWQRSSRL